MSFPYLSDLINEYFGTHWHLPIGMFGLFVAIAIFVAAEVAKKEVRRFETLGFIPSAQLPNDVALPPSAMLSNLTLICAMFGILGARLFHILEYPAEFLANPVEMIFSRAGLSIYGGLICGALAGVIYLRKYALPVIPMLDAFAPALALGYAIGRLGCQISGDGDWGTTANMLIKPEFLPDWLWAQTYQNNVAGVVIAAPGVYPTPLYESGMALLIFIILSIKSKGQYIAGYMISLYLLLSGMARLLVEQIRINSEYHLFNIGFTQAEFISALFILIGVYGVIKSHYVQKLMSAA